MRCLFDEQLSALAAKALTVLTEAHGHSLDHISEIGYGGATDDQIPGICATFGFGALVTLNVKDFGAKKVYFGALLAAGVHVGVVRPGKQVMHAENQIALLALSITRALDMWTHSDKPLLLVLGNGGSIRRRSLEELVAEVS